MFRILFLFFVSILPITKFTIENVLRFFCPKKSATIFKYTIEIDVKNLNLRATSSTTDNIGCVYTAVFSLVENGNDRNKFKYTWEITIPNWNGWNTIDSFEIDCKFNSQEHKCWKSAKHQPRKIWWREKETDRANIQSRIAPPPTTGPEHNQFHSKQFNVFCWFFCFASFLLCEIISGCVFARD